MNLEGISTLIFEKAKALYEKEDFFGSKGLLLAAPGSGENSEDFNRVDPGKVLALLGWNIRNIPFDFASRLGWEQPVINGKRNG